jgi:hypothetical protein
VAVDGRLPLRLDKGERRGYHRGSLLQIVSCDNTGDDGYALGIPGEA